MTLRTAHDNADFALRDLVHTLAAGTLRQARQIHAMCAYFRARGVCRLLLEGVAEGLHVNQMQEAGAYLFWLKAAAPEQKVTSWGNPFYAAVAGGFDDAAREIARHSRMTHNPDLEHEDDFLYVYWLMQRYALAEPEHVQRKTLERWSAVLDGKTSARFALCSALLDADHQGVEDALDDVLQGRQAEVDVMIASGKMPEDYARWIRPVCVEGLALLRLAERDGVELPGPFAGAPPVAREVSSSRFVPDAWQQLDS